MKKVFYLIITLLIVASCDVINQDPISDITQSSYWKNTSDATAGVNAMYDGLQDALGSEGSNLVNFGDARADGFILGGNRTNTNIQGVLFNQLTSANTLVNWREFYKAILRANLVLENIPNIDDRTLDNNRNRYLGEAYFVRALCYFYIVRLWGDAPYHTKPIVDPITQNTKVPKISANQILDSIEADLGRALPFVRSSTSNTDRNFANLGAVRALLTDVYLWRGKNRQAADTAARIINTPAFVLANNFQQLFPIANVNTTPVRNNNEIIFQLGYDVNQLEENFITRLFIFNSQGGSDFYGVSPKLVSIYEPNDQRALSTFSGAQITKFWGSVLVTNTSRRVSDNNIIIYRLADVILMRAEALAKLNEIPQALVEYNKIRSRAFRPATGSAFTPLVIVTEENSKEEVIDAILDERFREFVAEGKRWFDLVRNNKALSNPDIVGLTNSDELLWPITEDEIRIYNDPDFQNKGY